MDRIIIEGSHFTVSDNIREVAEHELLHVSTLLEPGAHAVVTIRGDDPAGKKVSVTCHSKGHHELHGEAIKSYVYMALRKASHTCRDQARKLHSMRVAHH